MASQASGDLNAVVFRGGSDANATKWKQLWFFAGLTDTRFIASHRL